MGMNKTGIGFTSQTTLNYKHGEMKPKTDVTGYKNQHLKIINCNLKPNIIRQSLIELQVRELAKFFL